MGTPFMPKLNKGRLFDQKIDKTKPAQPDYAGTINVNGQLMRISGWYNPPSETSRVATIGLQVEDYADYQDRIAAAKKARADKASQDHGGDPRDHPAPPPIGDDEIPF